MNTVWGVIWWQGLRRIVSMITLGARGRGFAIMYPQSLLVIKGINDVGASTVYYKET